MTKIDKELLEIELIEKIAVITLNNPPLNVLSDSVFQELNRLFESFENDDNVKVIIITGAGEKAFAAGADINEFSEHLKDTDRLIESGERGSKIFNKINSFPKPVIIALNGLTLGGGCELALCGDIRIASVNVKLGLPEINLGLLPGAGGTQRLPRIIGESKAKELIFTGNPITAEEAFRIGLVNKVVEQGQELETALELAKVFSQKSSEALRVIKETIDTGLEVELEEGIKKERKSFVYLFNQEDASEGINAFFEKRKPNFK